jgi:hypothetical protein
MAIASTTLTVLPTARPWDFLAGDPQGPGGNTVHAGWGTDDNDGTSGSAAVNAFLYGQQHTHAGETAPHTVAVTPGSIVTIVYNSGTVKAFSASTLYGPRGDTSATAGLSPTADYTDANGYTYPSDAMVYYASGGKAATQSGVQPTIGRVGLCGVFIRSDGTLAFGGSGSIAPFFDWKSQGGTDTPGSTITLFVPADAAFLSLGINDTILYDNGGAGFNITVNVQDISGYGGDQTFPTRYPVGIVCPAAMHDLLTTPNLKATVYMATMFAPLFDTSARGLLAPYVGQLFPHGGQYVGGAPGGSNGQGFPY